MTHTLSCFFRRPGQVSPTASGCSLMTETLHGEPHLAHRIHEMLHNETRCSPTQERPKSYGLLDAALIFSTFVVKLPDLA